jgi:hypothetical protein
MHQLVRFFKSKFSKYRNNAPAGAFFIAIKILKQTLF